MTMATHDHNYYSTLLVTFLNKLVLFFLVILREVIWRNLTLGDVI